MFFCSFSALARFTSTTTWSFFKSEWFKCDYEYGKSLCKWFLPQTKANCAWIRLFFFECHGKVANWLNFFFECYIAQMFEILCQWMNEKAFYFSYENLHLIKLKLWFFPLFKLHSRITLYVNLKIDMNSTSDLRWKAAFIQWFPHSPILHILITASNRILPFRLEHHSNNSWKSLHKAKALKKILLKYDKILLLYFIS